METEKKENCRSTANSAHSRELNPDISLAWHPCRRGELAHQETTWVFKMASS